VKPAGFTLPSAGLTPAPSEKKSRNDENNLSLALNKLNGGLERSFWRVLILDFAVLVEWLKEQEARL
jgi:hypothetical protein